MNRFFPHIRRPVKRQGAEQYLFLTLLSFAASVTLTRLFLELTGYPKVGRGEFHIAHVLWGGLLLYLAALLPLLIANRWSFLGGSLLAGIGVGLFIDEVGKFITQSNDYFYPLAAPIIYAFFLLTAIAYMRIRRPHHWSVRAELYRAFDMLEEVLERDLDPLERKELVQRLKFVAQNSDHPDLTRLANDLLDFLNSDVLQLVEVHPSLWSRVQGKLLSLEERYVSRRLLKAFVVAGLIVLGAVALFDVVHVLPISLTNSPLQIQLTNIIQQERINRSGGLDWYLAMIALETSVGLLYWISAGLLIASKDKLGTAIGQLGLLMSLTMVDLLVFYFDQFSTIVLACIQLVFLIAISHYRRSHLEKIIEPVPHLQTDIMEPVEAAKTEEQRT